jgi:glycosyltransferase involved in cell wall biosynthesis
MKILYVNKNDSRGGAARITFYLHSLMRKRGHESWLAVDRKETSDPDTLLIPDLPPRQGSWSQYFLKLRDLLKFRLGTSGTGYFHLRLISALADPLSKFEYQIGHEGFQHPGSRLILGLTPSKPELVHLHNLHDHYFDLRYLSQLSTKIPTFLTLHDEWLLTGHCAASLGCYRWKTGCGHCPDLTIYPAILRDGTRYNWRRKKHIYENSRLYVAAPSEWLMEKARLSILSEAMVESRIIPNGVDQTIFQPGDKVLARVELGLESSAKVVLIQISPDYLINSFKDFETIMESVNLILKNLENDISIVVVGSDEVAGEFHSTRVKTFGYIHSQAELAQFYQAADVYLHAAHSDNFPTVILEALSCGTPVVATAVGGIPEQVRHGQNGFLVKRKDSADMASKTLAILEDPILQKRLSANALSSARPYFSLERMVDKYESWYSEVIELTKRNPVGE